MKIFNSLFFLSFILFANSSSSQQIDTLAFQDFEVSPAAPIWNYAGTLDDVQSGNATAGASIPNTPLGIGSSQAWHVAQVLGGNEIVFDNTAIPAGYDSIRVNFKLAAIDLAGSGGPDNGDYVLVEYSLDNGSNWVSRMRIRGAWANNGSWAYDATGVAAVSYLPATEAEFQPTTSGVQVAEGYSFCEISFPGTITEIQVRLTPRSSSTSDSWLIDNLVLTGENTCTASASSFSETACDSYAAPSGLIYTSSQIFNDTIANVSGCDSVMTIDLTINSVDASASQIDALTIEATVAGATSYAWLDCNNSYSPISGATSQTYVATSNGSYAVLVSNNGCSDTSACYVVSSVGYDEMENFELLIYPNPVKDQLNITGLQNLSDDLIFEIVTLTGQVVGEYQINLNSLDLSGLPKGSYFLNAFNDTKIITLRFVKL